MLGSGACAMPKLEANCLTTASETSRPAVIENLCNTLCDDPLLFAAIIGDNDAHSAYIFFSFTSSDCLICLYCVDIRQDAIDVQNVDIHQICLFTVGDTISFHIDL